MYAQLTHIHTVRLLIIRLASLSVCSTWAESHKAYAHYALMKIRLFDVKLVNSYISDDLKVKIFRENDHELFKRVKDLPETTKILYQHYWKIFSNWRLSLRIVTFIIEYLGKTDFIFKKFLWDESEDQVSFFDEKKPVMKIWCLDTFNPFSHGVGHIEPTLFWRQIA